MVKTYSKIKNGKTQISPHFKIAEFACNDGSDVILIDDSLPLVLEHIRELCGGNLWLSIAGIEAEHITQRSAEQKRHNT